MAKKPRDDPPATDPGEAQLAQARLALLGAAAGGNLRAIALVASGAHQRLCPDREETIMAPHVAAAAIAAGLHAHELGPAATYDWLDRTFPGHSFQPRAMAR